MKPLAFLLCLCLAAPAAAARPTRRVRTDSSTAAAPATPAAPATTASAPAASPEKTEAGADDRAVVQDTPMDLAVQDDARKLAETYLRALSRRGSQEALGSLLGGATWTAKVITIPAEWRLIGRERHRREIGDLENVNLMVAAIDRAGREALGHLMGGGPGTLSGEDMSIRVPGLDDARRILEPVRFRANLLAKTHPGFAYAIRVDKQLFWNPLNPMRKLLEQAGAKGQYTIDLDLFWIQTPETATSKPRWPLRVIRFRANGVDTGPKILPAAGWDGE